MLRNPMFYNGQKINKLRDFRYSGKDMAEITLTVPREQISEFKIKSALLMVDTTSKEVDEKESVSQLLVVATKVKSKKEIELGMEGTQDYFNAIKEHGFSPEGVAFCLKGIQKTHKGYKFDYINKGVY